MEKTINLGMLGMGTVGCGVVELLRENRSLIERRVGGPVRIKTALVRNLNRERPVSLEGIRLTDDPEEVFGDPGIDMILELAGGKPLALRAAEHCLSRGIPLVTANKAFLAEESAKLAELCPGRSGYLGYDASVAGAVPILKTLHHGFCANEIDEIKGIINGTANYVLSSMETDNRSFAEALEEAKRLGYAEADPTFDVEGHDTAHKLCILMGETFGVRFPFEKVHLEGISGVSLKEIRYASKLGYRVKLLGIAKIAAGGRIEGRVHPALLPLDNPLASVMGAGNGIFARGNFSGPYLATGLGAGARPTASAVVSDVICHHRGGLNAQGKYFFQHPEAKTVPMGEIETEYYLRLSVKSRCGVLASIAGILAEREISISKVIQESSSEGGRADLVIVTETCREARMEEVKEIIAARDYCAGPLRVIRIEAKGE